MSTTASRPTPEKRGRFSHFMTITTRLMDNDLYSHVNNATYYSFIDTAVTSVSGATPLQRDLVRDPDRLFVVENGCTYFSPIAFPDVGTCRLRVVAIGGEQHAVRNRACFATTRP